MNQWNQFLLAFMTKMHPISPKTSEMVKRAREAPRSPIVTGVQVWSFLLKT